MLEMFGSNTERRDLSYWRSKEEAEEEKGRR